METPLFWAVVKINLLDPDRDADAFNAWYQVHVTEFVSRPSFKRGWRIETVPHEYQHADAGQHYWAIYEIESIEAFKTALDLSPTAGKDWGVWEGRVAGWSRTFYKLLTTVTRDDEPGKFWAILRANFAGTKAEEQAFNDWYNTKHTPEVCSNPGFHRAWRMEVYPHTIQSGPMGYQYMAVYEIDDPENFVAARKDKQPWDGTIWRYHVPELSRSFHRLLYYEEAKS